MKLANLGLGGLTAAQNRLQTTGHNINNSATEGYNRQSVQVQTAGARATGAGFVGLGVQVVSVNRAYDGFLFQQLVRSETTLAGHETYQSEVAQINNLFADRTVGISPALQRFFEGVHAVAAEPSSSAARQEMLGRASSLVTQVNDTHAFLQEQRKNVANQVSTLVSQVNSQVQRVHDLNERIVMARATSSSHQPNDLLDQRDQLVRELNQMMGVSVIEQEGRFNLVAGGGNLLLGAGTVYPLVAKASSEDPSRTIVATSIPGSNGQYLVRELDESRITGGQLGGLLKYRTEILDSVQNELGRLATGLAESFNQIHRTGMDLTGDTGGDFFTVGAARAIPDTRNTGTSGIEAQIDNVADLTGTDYVFRFSGTGASASIDLVSMPSGQARTLQADEITRLRDPDAGLTVDGVKFVMTGNAQDGDRWTVQPTRAAGGTLQLSIQEAHRVAVAAPATGSANGDVGLKLAQLESEKVLSGRSFSLGETYAQIVNKVGVLTQHNATSVQAQTTLVQQNFSAQQAISGVNLNEEYVNLERYQEQFRAASRLIEVSTRLFDTLLSMRT